MRIVASVLFHGGLVQTRAPRASTATSIAALAVADFSVEALRVAFPTAETHLVVRVGTTARGPDAHVLGPQQRARRKVIAAGQRAVIARLRLGAQQTVLGVSASSLAGRTVPLEVLWGPDDTARLLDAVASARTGAEAVAALEGTLDARRGVFEARDDHAALVRAAAQRLDGARVGDVAEALGVSERTLRRAFHEAAGMGPRSYARLLRFHRALGAARHAPRSDWARVAVACGYYDQAHLIAEFRAIAGVTPGVLLRELEGPARATLSTCP